MDPETDSEGKGVDRAQADDEPRPLTEAERIEEKIDDNLRDSFPASDPPGWTLGIEKRRPKTMKD